MGYCPRCDEKDGNVEWHRTCAMVVYAAAVLEAVPDDAALHHPKE
ncbi:hypothetical protein [Natrinema thermotolerans]|nr:hypothetical protein [Natrinema thermotolerans]